MSTVNTAINKQPLKFLEIPLNKFSEEVVPHHQKIYNSHKAHTLKLISSNNVEQALREVKDKKRIVRQLKDLLYELDTLRAQVEDISLDKFDVKTLSLRKIIMNLITSYNELEKMTSGLVDKNEDDAKENLNPFRGVSQVQLQEDLSEIKLKQTKETLNKVENLHRDIEDLHEIHSQLNEMVTDQRQYVEHVEESVESSRQNVESGLKQLIKAHRLKATSYPIAGAVLGGLVGGPIGAVAGLKIGGVAGLICAIAGYTGGKLFKKINDNSAEEQREIEQDLGVDKKDV